MIIMRKIERRNIMEYTITEIINTAKNGESYVPIKEHKLLNRVYIEKGYLQFELKHNVVHVGLGISLHAKFMKIK